ncbi:MAG: succinate dehydrogenase cytochrome b subunit [Saprospiraceae bacterium]|nr:succinate dehydrogenase cytochrome b subunit [Saprospiraceae bacterium]
MSWFSHFLTSSIGQKLVMSLTGLFLILFLLVHLAGNLQLLADDGGESFNVYARFMTTNPLIKTSSYLLYAFILLHTIQGIMLWRKNRASRGGIDYAVKRTKAVNTSALLSSRMAWLGIVIFVFLLIHMYQFWLQMKLGNMGLVTYDAYPEPLKDLYASVYVVYKNPTFVLFYVISMIVVGLHLWHGFQSAFQTLGLNHRKYTPLIHAVGKLYAIVIPALFALIPIYMYLFL